MNKKDRKLIANILGGISSGDTNTQINDGLELMDLHPEITKEMDKNALAWWRVEFDPNRIFD